MRWVKGHGTQNDFVLVPDPDGAVEVSARLAAAVCDRRAGLGGDGLLRVVRCAAAPAAAPWADEAEWFMDYRNADGSLAEMCGNGVRVFARYLAAEGLIDPARPLPVATRGGVRTVSFLPDGRLRADMGSAELPERLAAVEVRVAGRSWPAVGALLPNPHAVAFVDELADAGPLLEPPTVLPARAYPDGVNVEFVRDWGHHHVSLRVHERGSGETRSCGTGACAAAVVAAARAAAAAPWRWTVDVPGGRLEVEQTAGGRVLLTGPAVLVAAGTFDEDWLALHR